MQMSVQTEASPIVNGISLIPNINGKVKSKNQLRRAKLKQKKTAHAAPVRVLLDLFLLAHLSTESTGSKRT
jgi:hypothetical protein